ncbi:MAG: 4-hydroxy-tetrahydrodipicolinate reductase [Clostridiales bacterium]|nr:4-hydroxy-tetrahydrodipicolinate reductase [Clostridiales bacterium]
MRIAVVGGGRMGQLIQANLEAAEDLHYAGTAGHLGGGTLADIEGQVDGIIDFSNPANLDMIVEYTKDRPIPMVIATTGHTPEQVEIIRELAARMPVVFTATCSPGVSILEEALRHIAPALRETWDIEVIEKHHNQKLDSPSGTAKLLVRAVDGEETLDRVYGREGNRKRGREIGIHAVRGGNIVGDHTVLFAGDDEVLEFTHRASSRQIFAGGSLIAMRFALQAAPGLYSMKDVLFK